MSCELDKEQEIEDIIPTPRNLLQGEVEKLEVAVHDLLEANINSPHDFEKFITLEQKKVSRPVFRIRKQKLTFSFELP